MADIFTPELTFGLNNAGIMTPTSPGVPYRTINPPVGVEVWDDNNLTIALDSSKISTQRYRLFSSDGVNSGAIQGAAGLNVGDQYLVTFTIFSIITLGGGVRVGNTSPAFTALGTYNYFYTIEAGATAFLKRFSGITDITIGDVSFKQVL